jgi:hypothetical protein
VDLAQQLLEGGQLHRVVERRHHHQRRGAGLGRVRRQVHRVTGGEGAGAGHHGHPPAGGLDDQLGQLLALVQAQGRELPGAAARDEAVRAFLDQPVDVRVQGGGVDLAAVGGERGDERDEDAGEVGGGHGCASRLPGG